MRLRDLVAAARGVVPWRLPDADAVRERLGDLEPVADVEAGDEQSEPGDGERQHGAGRRRTSQEDERQEERRSEIFLNEEKAERDADADQHRQQVFQARQD